MITSKIKGNNVMREFKFMDSMDSSIKTQDMDYEETTRKYKKGINKDIVQELCLSPDLKFTDDSDDIKKAEAEFVKRGLFDRYQERLKERAGAKYVSCSLRASVMSQVLRESR